MEEPGSILEELLEGKRSSVNFNEVQGQDKGYEMAAGGPRGLSPHSAQ